MNEHVIMESFTQQWWICIGAVAVVIGILLYLPFRFSWAKSTAYSKSIAVFLLCNLLIENAYAINLGRWNMQNNLPLHMCGLAGLMCMTLLFRFNGLLAHFAFYWGTTGGIHSLLTPEFDLGTQGIFFYSYFISHGGLLLTSLFMLIHLEFKPEKNSWLTIFLLTQIAALVVGLFNWLTDSNYMYLLNPPIAENPLIIGSWPWYILIFELLALVHFWGLYKLSRLFNL